MPPPALRRVHQDQEVPNTFDCGHVCKVKLPLRSGERASSLAGGKRGLQYLKLGSDI